MEALRRRFTYALERVMQGLLAEIAPSFEAPYRRAIVTMQACSLLATSALAAETSYSRVIEIARTTSFPPPATVHDLDLPSMIPSTHAQALAQLGAGTPA